MQNGTIIQVHKADGTVGYADNMFEVTTVMANAKLITDLSQHTQSIAMMRTLNPGSTFIYLTASR